MNMTRFVNAQQPNSPMATATIPPRKIGQPKKIVQNDSMTTG